MAVGRRTIVVDLDRAGVAALAASVVGGKVSVRAGFTSDYPEDLDRNDARAVGDWLGSQLKEHGLGKGGTIVSLPRSDVVLKRLALPVLSSGDEDLGGMVRLQMSRQLTMPLDSTAIDYLPGSEGSAGRDTMDVLTGAVPNAKVEWCRTVCQHAGLKAERVTLRSLGIASVLSGLSMERGGVVLGIAPCVSSTEFVVADGATLEFVRAEEFRRPADAAPAHEHDRFVDRVATEARRTWMSYRVTHGAEEVETVAVLGDDPLCERLSRRCAEALEIPETPFSSSDRITWPEELAPEQRVSLLPLAGLLSMGGSRSKWPGLDFANPRKAPDRSAKRRQAVLLSLMLLILVGGGGRLLADMELRAEEAQLRNLREQRQDYAQQYMQYILTDARAGHLRAWSQGRADWLSHLARIKADLPETDEGLLDAIDGSLESLNAQYTPEEGYRSQRDIRLRIVGSVARRDVAASLRERLLSSGVYRVSTRGADTGDRFDLQLRTGVYSPDLGGTAEAEENGDQP